MNIYVGNLAHDVVEDELRQAFASFGEVSKVTIIKDRLTGEPRGFAFVEMPKKEEAEAALSSLNGKPLKGRPIKISEARPREERSDDGGGRRGQGGRDRY
jgi:RNA recognition motif-containing protein